LTKSSECAILKNKFLIFSFLKRRKEMEEIKSEIFNDELNDELEDEEDFFFPNIENDQERDKEGRKIKDRIETPTF